MKLSSLMFHKMQVNSFLHFESKKIKTELQQYMWLLTKREIEHHLQHLLPSIDSICKHFLVALWTRGSCLMPSISTFFLYILFMILAECFSSWNYLSAWFWWNVNHIIIKHAHVWPYAKPHEQLWQIQEFIISKKVMGLATTFLTNSSGM